MHTHHRHHIPNDDQDPFSTDRRREGRGAFGPEGRRRFRDPFAGPGPRRRGPRGSFGPMASGAGPDGPEPRDRGFGPGTPFGPGFGPAFGPGFERGRRGFGPDDPHAFGRGGHRRRAGRGDIRAAVLLLLAEQPRHGYELIREIAERTEGAWRPSPGAIYPALALLEDEGLVTLTADGGRRLASLSEAGQAYVTENAEELGNPFADATVRTPRPARALRGAMQNLTAATWQVAVAGDDTQAAAALAIVERATKDLYLLLAGEAPSRTADSAPPATDVSATDGEAVPEP